MGDAIENVDEDGLVLNWNVRLCRNVLIKKPRNPNRIQLFVRLVGIIDKCIITIFITFEFCAWIVDASLGRISGHKYVLP